MLTPQIISTPKAHKLIKTREIKARKNPKQAISSNLNSIHDTKDYNIVILLD
jgi:hypothetical protein